MYKTGLFHIHKFLKAVKTVVFFFLWQLEYSPRRKLGFGLSDGEQLERLWSFLHRFGKMTKEMRPSHRIDVISDAVLYYGRLCKDKLGTKRLSVI